MGGAPGAQVILAGSHARGRRRRAATLTSWSWSTEVDDDGGEAVRLMRGLRDLRAPTDVIVMSERHAEDWRDVRRSLLHAALSQGRVLAGRSADHRDPYADRLRSLGYQEARRHTGPLERGLVL
jgi:hypothetical protein